MGKIISKSIEYMKTWQAVMLQPIYFYTKLKVEDWRGKSLTFLLVTAWLMALFAAITIFIVQYIPIGSTLTVIVSGMKIIFILPVLATLAFVFFCITFLIFGGLFSAGIFIMLYLLGFVFHYIYTYLGGNKREAGQIIQALFYSSAAMLAAVFIFLMMFGMKYGALSFPLFRVGFDFIYFLVLLYLYGLWAVAGRKVYGVPKWKAFAGALVPVIILLIFGLLFDKIALPKLEPWIT